MTRSIGPVVAAIATAFFGISAAALTLEVSAHQHREFVVAGRTNSLHTWTLPDDPEGNGPLSIVAVVADSPQPSFRVIDVRKSGRVYELLDSLQCANAVALSNGGFYLEDGTGTKVPMGLAISSGSEINPFRPRKYGGFAILDDSPQVISVRERNIAEGAEEAIQSSPILVLDGKNDMISDDGVKFNRTAIGITSEGNVSLLGAFRPRGSAISLYEFAEALVQMQDFGGPDFRAVLAMDGGPGSQLIVPATDDVYGYDGPNYLPNALCLDIREEM